jgi:hypothetical protein
MLIFSPKVERESSGPTPRAEAFQIVKAFLIRTTVIIDDALAKMIAVAEWGARDTAKSRVNALNVRIRSLRARGPIAVGLQLPLDRVINRTGITVFGSGTDLLRTSFEHVQDAQSGPWAYPNKSSVYLS